MNNSTNSFELPKGIDRYLAAVSKLYAQEGKRLLQEIIVNSQTRIHEEWSRDNWDGGIYGHALYLVMPEQLFLSAVKQKDVIRNQIKEDLNRVHNVQNEFIQEVFLEMEVAEDSDWRRESGLLSAGKRVVPADTTKRIWGEEGFRLFISHRNEVKKETGELKESLRQFGISCFVAHQDIHPTKAWQDEIENALASMDGFIALMTENFHDSDWTDQEVGFAFARDVPIIAVKLGKDPYGFIGKFQALSSTWATASEGIAKILINNERMFSFYLKELRKCLSWESGNNLAKILSGIAKLDSAQIDELIAAYNENRKLQESFGFNGNYVSQYGSGLVTHLNRLSSRQFRFDSKQLIEGVA
jgi:hypothetical protein